LAAVEFASVLARKTALGELDADVSQGAYDRFIADTPHTTVIGLEEPLISEAAALLLSGLFGTRVRAQDGIQLASARWWLTEVRRLGGEPGAFIVADRRLREAAIALGLPVENPEDYEPADAYTHAADILHAGGRPGGIVALPTDTVYGLCARADDPAAIERIYAIKQRDPSQAMPIFVADIEQAEQIADFNDTARALASAFWSGALTVVVPVRDRYDSRALAGGRTVALRAPGDHRIRDLCAAVGPLTGTSANIAGREECHTAAEVHSQLGDTVDLIVDAPVDATGQPSTIVDCTDPAVVGILRVGAITRAAIATALPRGVQLAG
jgi:L-threonylcarbamoyladenylate synthase